MIISSNLCHGSLKKKKKEVSRWRLVNLPPRYARYFLIEKLFPLVFIIIHSVSSIYVISDNQSLHRVCLFGCVNTFESKNALSIEIISFFFFFPPPNTRIIIVVISVNAKTPRNIFFPSHSISFFLIRENYEAHEGGPSEGRVGRSGVKRGANASGAFGDGSLIRDPQKRVRQPFSRLPVTKPDGGGPGTSIIRP